MNISKYQNIEKFLDFFTKISKIPRGSGYEKEISNWLVDFAKKRNLDVIQDKYLNVVIKKPGTSGYEKCSPIILQGHMDMVWVKNADTSFDFENEGLNLYIEGDFLKAKGTTLGADNGLAVAFFLALLDSNDIIHPPLEVLITTEEETGMNGAKNIDSGLFSGKHMINMDITEDNSIYVSCAGGAKGNFSVPITKEKISKDIYQIDIAGLLGGHSGTGINKGRANAIKLLGRLLYNLKSKINFNIVSISGGSKDNVIPSESTSTISINPSDIEHFSKFMSEFKEIVEKEYATIEKTLSISFHKIENCKSELMFDQLSSEKVVKILYLHPSGIKNMSYDFHDLVETSINLGVVKEIENSLYIESSVRSSVNTRKKEVISELELIAEMFECTYELHSTYPEWEYSPNSEIRDLFFSTYKNEFNEPPKIKGVHAGLESAILHKIFNKNLDIISIGANIYDIHSPDERLSLSSTEKLWKWFTKSLREYNL